MSEDAIAQELRALRDIEEIKQLKARHCRLVDTKDWAGWAETCLTEDFRLDSGGGVQEGRDVVVDSVSKSLGTGSTVHHVYTPEITLTGPETATGIWPMEDWIRITIDGNAIAFHGCGHYHEEYVRTDQGWRIKSSRQTRLRMDPIDPDPASDAKTG
jgi:SnoaL-like protein